MIFSFLALLPFQARLGPPENCYDFNEVTVCLLEFMPYYVPIWAHIEDNKIAQALGTLPTIKNEIQRIFTAEAECQPDAQWHLLRSTSHESIYSSTTYGYSRYDGYGSSVFVFDTWVDVEHPGFNIERRPQRLKSFAQHNDSNYPAHGTHVTGLVSSQLYGAARGAKVYTVQVLNDEGVGNYAGIIQALHYAHQYVKRHNLRRIVFNLSLGGGQSQTFDRVINDLSNDYMVVVAAGNENQDTALSSPGSAIKAFTVAAINIRNEMVSFSNYGKNVKIQAPGESILSLCPDKYLCWMSGTSMASPIVAGIVAVQWSRSNYLTRQELEQYLYKSSTKGLVKGIKGETVNSVIYFDQDHEC